MNEWMVKLTEGARRNRHHLLMLTIMTVLALAVCGRILLEPGTLIYGDFVYPRDLSHFGIYPMWNEYGQYTNLDFANRALGFGPLLVLAQALSIPSDVFVKGMLVGNLLLIGLSMYLASSWVARRSFPEGDRWVLAIACLCVSVAYMFNPWSMNRIEHYFLWTGYALSPLVAMCTFKAIGDRDLKAAVAAGLLWTLSSTSIHYALFCLVLVVSIALFEVCARRSLYGLKTALTYPVIIGLVFLATSAFWLYPYVLSIFNGTSSPSTLFNLDILYMLSMKSDLPNVVTLTAYWWPRVDYTASGPILRLLWPVTAVVLPILAYVSLLVKRNKFTAFFVALAVVATVLSMGTNGPFGGIYRWVTLEAPLISQFGWVLRDPDKWSGLLVLSYCFLAAITMIGMARSKPWARLPFKRLRRETAAASIIAVLFLSSFAVYASPTVDGYLNGIFSPVEVPKEYITTNDWLSQLPGDFNVIWFPTSNGLNTTWSSHWISNLDNMYSSRSNMGSNTIDSSYYRSFLTHVLAGNETHHFEKYLNVAGIGYLVVRDDVPDLDSLVDKVGSSLPWQEGLTLVREDGSITVYAVDEGAKSAYSTNDGIVIVGGLDDLTSLYDLDGFNSTRSAIVFAGDGASSGIAAGTVLISNAQLEDLLYLCSASYGVVAPFDHIQRYSPATTWSAAATNDPLHGEWHTHLDDLGIDNWEFDYGMGMAITWADDPDNTLSLPLDVPSDGRYYISLRYFESVAGGQMDVLLDGEPLTALVSSSSLDRFHWETLGPIELTEGPHQLLIRNSTGLNAVNMAMLTPEAEWLNASTAITSELAGRNLVYLFEGESDLAIENGTVDRAMGGWYSQGKAVELAPNGLATVVFTVFEEGDYNLSVQMRGDLTVRIDGSARGASSAGLSVVEMGPVHLAAGEHRLTIAAEANGSAVLDAIWLYTSEQTSLLSCLQPPSDHASETEVISSDPTHTTVRMHTDRPLYLVSDHVYDSNWVAVVNGKEYRPIKVNAVLSGFLIDQTGDLDVTIMYKPQGWFDMGALLTGLSLLAITAVLVVEYRSRKRRRTFDR